MSDDAQSSPEILVLSDESTNNSGITIQPNLIELEGLNPDLTFHKLFLFQELVRGPGGSEDYFVKANVAIFRNGKPSVVLPASIGQDINNTLLGQTLMSVFPCFSILTAIQVAPPCSPVPESITLTLSKHFTGLTTVAIVGFARIQGSIDKVTLNVEGAGVQPGKTINAYRAVLGIISSANPL
jgi:hypothetical protein